MDKDNNGGIILYTTPDGESRIEVTLRDDTVWLSADQMAELFQRNKSTISRHIKNVLESGELHADSTVAFLQQFKMKVLERLSARLLTMSARYWQSN